MNIISQNGHEPEPDELKARVDLRQLAYALWGPPKYTTHKCDMYYAPWRSQESHPSFAVNDDRFKDFGNEDHGDHFDLLQREGLAADFLEAKRWLLNYADRREMITTPDTQVRHRPPTNEPPPIPWQQAMEKALVQTQDFLWSDDPIAIQVLDYLHTVRGLTDETIRHFGLGFNPSWLKTDYEDESGHKKRLWPGIVIPIFNGGVLWALRVRCIVGNLADHLRCAPHKHSSGEPVDKYMNVGGSKLTGTLFNGDAIDPGKNVVMTEGEFDAMLAQQILGFDVTVVSLGPASNRLSNRWHQALQDVEDIYIIPDQDEEGQGQAAGDALVEALGDKAHQLILPMGKDVTDFVVDHHGDLRAWFLGHRCWFPDGVPDTWRSGMLNYMPKVAALIFELFNEAARAGLIDSQAFTINALIQANKTLPTFNMAPSTLRREFPRLEGVFFSKLDTMYLDTIVSKNENNSSGRKPNYYATMTLRDIQVTLARWAEPRIVEKRFPAKGKERQLIAITPAMLAAANIGSRGATLKRLNVIEHALDIKSNQHWRYGCTKQDHKQFMEDLNDHSSTPLPEDCVLHHSSSYYDALLKATIASGPEEGIPWSRRGIRDYIGIANGSVTAVMNRVGIESEDQYVTVRFDPTMTLEKQLEQKGKEAKGYPHELVAEIPGEEPLTCPTRNMEQCHIMIQDCLAAGRSIDIRFQTASLRRLGEPMMTSQKWPSSRQRRSRSVTARPTTKKKAFFGASYDPEWVKEQLILWLEALGWQDRHDGSWLHPSSGEVINRPDTPEALIALLLTMATEIEKGDEL